MTNNCVEILNVSFYKWAVLLAEGLKKGFAELNETSINDEYFLHCIALNFPRIWVSIYLFKWDKKFIILCLFLKKLMKAFVLGIHDLGVRGWG